MPFRRSRILAALLALMVAFHWLPGAFASAASPSLGVICGEPQSTSHDGALHPGSGDACKHQCNLCSGTGVSAPAIVSPPAPQATAARLLAEPRPLDLTASLWAPVRARPPPRG